MMRSRRLLAGIGVGTLLLVPFSVQQSGGMSISFGYVSAAGGTCGTYTGFKVNAFSNPLTIQNTHFPLVPGTQFVYEGRANRGGGPLPHTVQFTVTDLKKNIDGVESLVVWDVDTNNNVLSEAELAFFAQDNASNVWALGEYPEEYEGGVFAGAPSTWISGTDNARAGVHIVGAPTPGMNPYQQGRSIHIQFYDCAQPIAVSGPVCVPAGCFTNVLVTDEWDPKDKGVIQRKYYAPGVGLIQVEAVDDPEGETLVLTQINHLTGASLASARAAALQLDAHGYVISSIYAESGPAVGI